MKSQPVLDDARMQLRPFALSDAPVVQLLAGDADVALMTLRIPHPYENGMAETWIRSERRKWGRGEGATFAVCRKPGAELIGCMSLGLDTVNHSGELGYWIGKPWWNLGYATDAARRLLRFGFEELGLNRIHAHHLSRNPGSGRVMQKIGLRREGRLLGHLFKDGRYEDVELYGLVARDYEGGYP